MKVIYNGKEYLLQGGDAWNEKRFEVLKTMNKTGKVVIIDDNREKYLVPIGELTVEPESYNY